MEDTAVLEPLTEIATIAAGHGATALSKLMSQQVTMTVPSVQLVAVEALSSMVGPASQVATAGLVKLEGDLHGLMLFSLSPTDADAVSKGVIDQQTTNGFNDVDQSVLREMVNIAGGAAVSSLATFLKVDLKQSIPASATDMIGAVIDPFMAELGGAYDKVLLLHEEFNIETKGINLKMIIVVDPPSTTTLLQKISTAVSGGHEPNH